MNSFNNAFESLEDRLLMSSEPTLDSALLASAQAVELQTLGAVSVNSTLDGNKDIYQFTTPSSGKMSIAMSSLTNELDSYLVLYDSKGHRIRGNNNAQKGTLDSLLNMRTKPGRTYYVVASGANDTDGSYTMKWTNTPTDDLGNSMPAARSLGLRSRVSSMGGRINYNGDVDVIAFTATKSGAMTVSMNAVGWQSNLDPLLTVLDANGKQLSQDDDSGEGLNAQVTLDVQAGQTYYLQATSADGSTGVYHIKMTIVQAPPTPPAPPAPLPNPDDTGDVTPGASITTSIVTTETGLQLVVTGTDANDVITLSQTMAGLTMTTAGGSQQFDGAFESIVVYGFAGNDSIRFTSSVTASGCVLGGDGNDSIYLAGTGVVNANGGAGDDLLVSVGGGVAALAGGDGRDSFWLDTVDSVSDASSAENAVNAVHRIAEFYQPYASSSSSEDYIPLTIAGQNFRDPALTSYARGYANFSNVPVFTDGAQYNDIAQGGVGDCYYLASLASLASTDPEIVRQAVAPLGDGTYAVRFFRSGQSVYLRVDGDMPVSSGTNLAYAKTGADGELWVPLMEKAYSFFRYGQNSYGSINGGWMADVFIAVTGVSPTSRSTTGTPESLFGYLQTQLTAGHAPTLASNYSASGPVVGSHAYMIKSVQQTSGGMTVTVYNPWGIDGKSFDSNPNDGLLTLTIAQIQQYYSAVVTSLA